MKPRTDSNAAADNAQAITEKIKDKALIFLALLNRDAVCSNGLA